MKGGPESSHFEPDFNISQLPFQATRRPALSNAILFSQMLFLFLTDLSAMLKGFGIIEYNAFCGQTSNGHFLKQTSSGLENGLPNNERTPAALLKAEQRRYPAHLLEVI